MGLELLFFAGMAIMVLTAVSDARRRFNRRPPATVRRRGPTRRPDVADSRGPYRVERWLTERMLGGDLEPAVYQHRMADLASTSAYRTEADDVPGAIALGADSGGLRGRLRAAMPELSRATLDAAVNLARFGAGVEDLVRLLGMTTGQALRITVSTPGAADHRG